MGSEKIFTVVNPAANNGKTGKTWSRFEKMFINKDIDLEVVFTEYPGHASELSRKAVKAGFKKIMAVGGDGTVNEVINGLFCKNKLIEKEIKLIILARGSGSDLVKTMGISSEVREIVDIIKNKKIKYIDVASISYLNFKNERQERVFINIADIGFGGATVHYLENSRFSPRGMFKYLIGAFNTIFHYQNQNMKLVIDDNQEIERKMYNVVVANGRYFAGGMKIAPEASLTDEKLNVITVNNFSRLELLLNFIKVYNGSHLDHPKVDKYQSHKIKIISETDTYIDLDGEAVGKLPAEIELISQKLPVMVM